eukprot:scaffold2947_cov67-Phaeocystis_antarctica.AAC.2
MGAPGSAPVVVPIRRGVVVLTPGWVAVIGSGSVRPRVLYCPVSTATLRASLSRQSDPRVAAGRLRFHPRTDKLVFIR